MAPRLPFYAALHTAVPLFQAVRVPARLSQVVLLMVAVLAGFGVLGNRETMAAGTDVAGGGDPGPAGEHRGLPRADRLHALRRRPRSTTPSRDERNAVVVELPFPIPSSGS